MSGTAAPAAALPPPPPGTARRLVPLAPPGAGGGAAAVANVPEWVHLVPAGTFTGVDGRGPYHAGDPAALAAASLAPGARPLLVDFDHAADLLRVGRAASAPAAGWIAELRARADGLWGRVEWTPDGREAVASRRYRYLSPVFRHAPDGAVTRLLRAGLVNSPNIAELTALNAEGAAPAMDPERLLAELREALDLPADAGAPAILEAVRRLTTAASAAGGGGEPDPARYVPIALFRQAVAEANASRQGVSREAAEIIVRQAQERRQVMPFMRDWAVALCMANRPAFDAFVAGVGPGVTQFLDHLAEPGIKDVPARMAADRERAGGGGPAGEGAGVFAALGLTEADVKKYGSRQP